MYGGSSPGETADREHDFSKQLLTVSRISIQLAHNKLLFFSKKMKWNKRTGILLSLKEKHVGAESGTKLFKTLHPRKQCCPHKSARPQVAWLISSINETCTGASLCV